VSTDDPAARGRDDAPVTTAGSVRHDAAAVRGQEESRPVADPAPAGGSDVGPVRQDETAARPARSTVGGGATQQEPAAVGGSATSPEPAAAGGLGAGQPTGAYAMPVGRHSVADERTDTGTRVAERPERPTGARAAARPQARRPRRASLVLRRIDPWSVFLFSLVASVCLGIVLIVAVTTLYAVLSSLGVLSSVNNVLGEVLGGNNPGDVAAPVFTAGRVLGGAAVLAAVDVVLLTVLATLGALLYNLCASLTGGIEVQLSERD
jgi:hypothetical protein